MIKCEELYKIDSKGGIRVWYIEYDHEKYRSVSGLVDGKLVQAGWVYPTEKNVGKANSTTIEEQVIEEVTSIYKHQLHQGKYHNDINKVSDGANFIECLLAATYKEKKHNKFPYMKQPKLDGARCLGYDGLCQSRNGKYYLSVPHIQETTSKFSSDFPGYVLDGELYNHELKSDFETLMSIIRKTKNISDQDIEISKNNVFYYVYDVITPFPMTTEERINFLRENVYGKYEYIVEVETKFVKTKEDLEGEIVLDAENGYEGTMLRTRDSYYVGKRCDDLIKCKTFIDIECLVLDITDGDGVWRGRAKSATLQLPSGVIQNSNIIGNFAKTKELFDNKEKYIGGQCTVKFQGYTNEGKMRFPFVKFFWGGNRDV